MLSGYFIPGLASFLLAHLCYLALFRQGAAVVLQRPALAATLPRGGDVCLPVPASGPVLKVAVAAYATW
jgi:alkylglycerol monooxygenase